MTSSKRVGAGVILVALAISGCQEAAPEAEGADSAPAAADVLATFPDKIMEGFPETFPAFPDGAVHTGTTYTDRSAPTYDDAGRPASTNTIVTETRRAWLDNTTDGGLDTVWEFYRTTLPAAGWEITDEELLERAQPTVAIRFSGHGAEGSIDVVDDWSERIIISTEVWKWLPEASPYEEFGPHIPVPDWYTRAQPELPPGGTRTQVALEYHPNAADVPRIRLSTQYSIDGDLDESTFDSVEAHLRSALPAAGWTFVGEEPEGGLETGAHRTKTLHFQGYGSLLEVFVREDRGVADEVAGVSFFLGHQEEPA